MAIPVLAFTSHRSPAECAPVCPGLATPTRYDSYHIAAVAWAQLLAPLGRLTLRGTDHDGVFIGLWLEAPHGRELVTGGFDGAYTYFASGVCDLVHVARTCYRA